MSELLSRACKAMQENERCGMLFALCRSYHVERWQLPMRSILNMYMHVVDGLEMWLHGTKGHALDPSPTVPHLD